MAKQTPFFKFDSASWLGGSIQFTDLECKGLFIDLCAVYWETQKPVKIDTKLKVRTRCPEGTLSNLIGTLSDLDIIVQSEHGITIPFLDSLMSERSNWLKKCSESGKKAHTNQGTSSNKKEERRKKREEYKTSLWLDDAKPEYLEFCKSYFDMLLGHELIKANANWKTKAWYDAARLMVERDGITLERMRAALRYLNQHIKNQYCPQAHSLVSFREKWVSIRSYKERQNTTIAINPNVRINP